MTEPSATRVLRLSDDVVFRELDGEALILNLASGMYFGLDPVGTRIWQLIEQTGDVQAMVGLLRDEYDVPADVLEGDVERLVSALLAKGLVTHGSHGTGA